MGIHRAPDPRVVVLVSANSEWRAVKEILMLEEVSSTPLGEMFSIRTGNQRVTFFHGGWGKIAAAASTQYVIDHLRPKILINLGTCGGFDGRIERGTILLVTKTIVYDILEQMSDPDEAVAHYSTEMDLTWLPKESEWINVNDEYPLRRDLLVSADRDLLPNELPMLVERYNAVAADWESGTVAWTAKKNGVRCLILRGVTDLVGSEGGEAYGNIEVFHENTSKVMRRMIEIFKELMAVLEI